MSALWCVAPSHSQIVINFETNPVQILSRDQEVGNNYFFFSNNSLQLWQNKITGVDSAANICNFSINQRMEGSFDSVTYAMPFGVVFFLFETCYESVFTEQSFRLSFVLLVLLIMPVSHSTTLNTGLRHFNDLVFYGNMLFLCQQFWWWFGNQR